MEENQKKTKNIAYFARRYVQEFFEACIGLYIISIVSKNKLDHAHFIRNAAILACATLALEEYNPSYADSVKQGLAFTIGASTAVPV